MIKWPGNISFFSISQKSTCVEHCFNGVLEDQKQQSDSGEVEKVSSSDECDVEGSILDSWAHVLSLDLKIAKRYISIAWYAQISNILPPKLLS